jgi:DNA-binding MarR family transcriptional regulator
MLRRGGPPYRATPGELATQLGLSPAAMTNRLDALERLGYVRRDHDRDDRRRIVATLTKPGYEIWQRGIGDICRVEEELVNELDAGEQDRLQALLRQLVIFTEKHSAEM